MSNPNPPLDNLVPFKPGQSGNPSGRPKGIMSLASVIRELEENTDWDKTTLKSKEELQKKYGKNGFKALVYVAFSKGMSGDMKAMEWLAKHGYGEKLQLEINDPRKEILEKYLGGDDEKPKDATE